MGRVALVLNPSACCQSQKGPVTSLVPCRVQCLAPRPVLQSPFADTPCCGFEQSALDHGQTPIAQGNNTPADAAPLSCRRLEAAPAACCCSAATRSPRPAAPAGR